MDRTRFNSQMHHRRSIRLKNYDYSQAGAYFVTICTYQRSCVFGEIVDESIELSAAGAIVVRCWDEIPQHFPGIGLDAFIVMPNHLHAVILISDQGPTLNLRTHEASFHPSRLQPRSLGSIVGQFKAASAKHINRLRGDKNRPIWQRNYFERIIRDEDELGRIREYVANNPLTWPEDDEHPSKMGTSR